jgi:RNA polymerase sigma-70 factor (ECF subfamily)
MDNPDERKPMNDAMMRNDSRSAKPDQHEAESEQERSGSFGAIYDRYAASIFRYLISRTGNVEEAKDLTSQTFLTAIEAFPRYQDQGYVSAWLFSIARSTILPFQKVLLCCSTATRAMGSF